MQVITSACFGKYVCLKLKIMDTTLKNTANFSTHSTKVETKGAYKKLIEKLTFSYFGLMTVTITVGSILGAISAMQVLANDAPIWQLGLVMAAAMANNVSGIGQAPTKWVVNLFLFSVLISVIFYLANL